MAVTATPTRATALDDVPDWRTAVRASAGLLVELGTAPPEYVDACVDSVDVHGPYIVLTKGVALAHAQTEAPTSDGLALVRLREPVAFGHPTNDPVDLVFAFSTEAGRHLEMIRAFGIALGAGLPDRLRAAGSDEELTELLAGVASDG